MANREALRELQTRLASRLQAARSEGAAVAWLAVRVGGRNLLFPLAQSGEIFPLVNVQPVPYARPWFRGVLNIRGSLYGVVDLADFMAQSGGGPRTEPASMDPSVVTINPALEINCALQIDNLLGLRGADGFSSSAPPETGAPAYFGHSFTDTAGTHWQEINLRLLSLSPEFLNISA